MRQGTHIVKASATRILEVPSPLQAPIMIGSMYSVHVLVYLNAPHAVGGVVALN